MNYVLIFVTVLAALAAVRGNTWDENNKRPTSWGLFAALTAIVGGLILWVGERERALEFERRESFTSSVVKDQLLRLGYVHYKFETNPCIYNEVGCPYRYREMAQEWDILEERWTRYSDVLGSSIAGDMEMLLSHRNRIVNAEGLPKVNMYPRGAWWVSRPVERP